MQFSIVALSLFAAAATAQNSTTSLPDLVSQLPPCALPCFSTAAESASCEPTDFECLCGTQRTEFINDIGPCVVISNVCSSQEIDRAVVLAGQICTNIASDPDPTAVASASNIITSALASETAAATATPGAAARPELGMGMLGVAAIAAIAL
jgi:hypothetical protein